MDTLQARIAQLMAKGFSQRGAADMLGVSLGKLQRTLNKVAKPDDTLADIIAKQLKAQEKLVAQLQQENRDLVEAARERELAGQLKFEPIHIPVNIHPPGSPGMPVSMWSDWHCGEVVDKRETGGLNEFNRKVFNYRVNALVERTSDLLFNYGGTNPEYPGIWILIGGDMVSGLIHDELVESNWGNIVEQAMEVCSAISGALVSLADTFGAVHVPCVSGNHGRTTDRPRAKGRALDSYDRAIYKSLERHFADDPRITFYIPDNTDYLFSIYEHRFMLTHGDSLGTHGGDGIIGALGPIIRGATKLHRSEAQVGRDFDTLVLGHYHQYIPRAAGLGIIVNNSLKGYDEYARLFLRAPFTRPSQALWLVSPKHGIAAQWEVFLD